MTTPEPLTPLEELESLIWESGNAYAAAEKVVAWIADHYIRKPRVVTTLEELDALPQESVVRDAEGYVFDRDAIVTLPHPLRWHPAGVAADVGSSFLKLPATVLYTPDAS